MREEATFEEKIEAVGDIKSYFFSNGNSALSTQQKDEIPSLYEWVGSVIRRNNGGKEIMRYLKKISTNELQLLNKSDGRTLLMDIVLSGAFNHREVNEVLESILVNRQESEDSVLSTYINTRDNIGRSVLTCALTAGNISAVTALLDLNIEWRAKDINALVHSYDGMLIDRVLNSGVKEDVKNEIRSQIKNSFSYTQVLIRLVQRESAKFNAKNAFTSDELERTKQAYQDKFNLKNDCEKRLDILAESINQVESDLTIRDSIKKQLTGLVKRYKELDSDLQKIKQENHRNVVMMQYDQAQYKKRLMSTGCYLRLTCDAGEDGKTQYKEKAMQLISNVELPEQGYKLIIDSLSLQPTEKLIVILDSKMEDEIKNSIIISLGLSLVQQKEAIVAHFDSEMEKWGSLYESIQNHESNPETKRENSGTISSAGETKKDDSLHHRKGLFTALDQYFDSKGKYGKCLYQSRLTWMGMGSEVSLASGRLAKINKSFCHKNKNLFLDYWILEKKDTSVVFNMLDQKVSGKSILSTGDLREFAQKNKNCQKLRDQLEEMDYIKGLGF